MTTRRFVSRRVAIADMGRAGLALVVFGATACSTQDTPGEPSPATENTTRTTSPAPVTTLATTTSSRPVATARYQRVDLGFVSGYVLYRGGEAALIDTGVEGSAPSIEMALAQVGLGWEDIAHVVATHKHPDHVGSLSAVLKAVPEAAVYAGAGDIPSIRSPRPLQPVGDGDRVFDLDVIETPGHTPGHISVVDSVAGILVAGDALNGVDGGVAGANPRFSEDMALANASVRKLATFSYQVALFGHGEPVESEASAAVSELAAGL